MAKHTRLATTITANYVAAQGATDAFYLDGRMSQPRRFRTSDITLDRTDVGFYYAIFASTELAIDSDRTYAQKKRSLDRIADLIKDENRGNIDSAINDMAENAVHMTGRLTISDNQSRHPYYAGILVREGEMAAVTMSSGLAYLYRNDALFPLTQDDFPMEAVDQAGNPVDNFDIYGAGKAGTIRYSNISQIQVDDCIILTTREVMETIGQQGMLDLLEQAYDQEEAAEAVADIMAQNAAGVPFQFMMSFVEDIILPSRRGRGRDQTGMHRVVTEQTISESAMTDETTRFDPKSISPYSAAAAGLVKPSEPESPGMSEVIGTGKSASDAIYEETAKAADTTDAASQEDWGSEAEDKVWSRRSGSDETQERVTTYGDSEPAAKDLTQFAGAEGEDEGADHEPVAGEPDYTVSGTTAASALYGASRTTADTEEAKSPAQTSAQVNHRLDINTDNEWEESTHAARPKRNQNGRILLTILVIVLLALIFIGVAYLLNRDNASSGTTTPGTTTLLDTSAPTETTLPSQTTTPPTTETTTELTTSPSTSFGEAVTLEGANGGTYPSVYHVQSGDTFYAIFDSVYAAYDLTALDNTTVNELIQLFIDANPDTISGSVENNDVLIYADTIINVPDPSEILTAN